MITTTTTKQAPYEPCSLYRKVVIIFNGGVCGMLNFLWLLYHCSTKTAWHGVLKFHMTINFCGVYKLTNWNLCEIREAWVVDSWWFGTECLHHKKRDHVLNQIKAVHIFTSNFPWYILIPFSHLHVLISHILKYCNPHVVYNSYSTTWTIFVWCRVKLFIIPAQGSDINVYIHTFLTLLHIQVSAAKQ